MTGIPQPHSADEDDPPIIPGPKESFSLPETSEWVRVPDRPGFWRNTKTKALIYIPPIPGIPQRPL